MVGCLHVSHMPLPIRVLELSFQSLILSHIDILHSSELIKLLYHSLVPETLAIPKILKLNL